MDPIIIVRDVSEPNHQPKKVFSTNIEINKTGHRMYHPSENHTKYNLVKKFGENIGTLMYFLLKFPMMDSVYITSYEIVVALKHEVNVKDWSPTIDNMIKLSVEALAKKKEEDSIVFQVQICKNYLNQRSYVDVSRTALKDNANSRFWKPMRTSSTKYLKMLGKPWTTIVPPILKIPGVEEVEPFYNTFFVLIGEAFMPRWDFIDENLRIILAEALHQDVLFKY